MGERLSCSPEAESLEIAYAKGVPSWALAPAILGWRVWLKVCNGFEVMGLNNRRTVAVKVAVNCESKGGKCTATQAGTLSPFIEPLTSVSPLLDVEVGEHLILRVPIDKAIVEIVVPVEEEDFPLGRLPESKAKASAHGVFEETVEMLKKLKGSGGVRIKVRATGDKLSVEPPRKVFKVDGGVEGVLEVKVFFADLLQALRVFKVAGLSPHVIWLGENVLGVEAECKIAKVVALLAGQID
ncbi:MAG: hypothetical protein NZ954_06860 [Thermofilaceae archaeon]|nr:hypothetical protein [Thermofilaceae archaeon]MCX8179773.1 hypothetical protein [Thermofilaceae archaeon]MDW8004300.1 hypothetical protein [Thermofilaceae archaeon]